MRCAIVSSDVSYLTERIGDGGIIIGRRTYDIMKKSRAEIFVECQKYVITNELLEKAANTSAIFITDAAKFIRLVEMRHENIFVIGGTKIYNLFTGMYDVIYRESTIKLVEDLSNFTIVSTIVHNNNNIETWIKNGFSSC